MARRKTDKRKLAEGRGTGRGKSYKPWIRIHEFGSSGRATRQLDFESRRVSQLLSDLEHHYNLIARWSKNVIDVREQYMLTLEETVLISKELNIRHPSEKNQQGKEYVMSTDFVITIQDGDVVKDIARTIKPTGKMTKRVQQKFLIEEEYWKRKGVDWGVVTEKEIPKTLGQNLKYLYCNNFWLEKMNISKTELGNLVRRFRHILVEHNGSLDIVTKKFEEENGWIKGESWNFIEYMILKKIVKTDLINKKFSYDNLKIMFNDEENYDSIFEK